MHASRYLDHWLHASWVLFLVRRSDGGLPGGLGVLLLWAGR